jgi:hypothetical protein
MARQPAPYNIRRSNIVNRGGTQTVEAENGFVVGIVNRKECFRTARFVALAGVPAEDLIQYFFAAVKPFPIMVLVDGLFVPSVTIMTALATPAQLPAVLRSAQVDSPADSEPANYPFRTAAHNLPPR